MDEHQVLRGVDSEISQLPKEDRRMFEEEYNAAISDDFWLSMHGITEKTPKNFIRKILYEEFFNDDYFLMHMDLCKN